MLPTLPAIAAVALGASAVLAQSTTLTCALNKQCPEETPCCSQYGQCGVGAYCLGGCDPRSSFSLDSCVPSPVCKSKQMSMGSTDGLINVKDYLGDASKGDWVFQGSALARGGSTYMTMAPHTAGTVLASTVYMWYGNVKASIKAGKGAGVVTAFILYGDMKDEIDYEWVGNEVDTAQTNYYFQGIPDYTHSENITDLSDTTTNFHEYEIRWTPDKIEWLVDGKVGRSMEKADTWNATANQWDFPQTPARVQLSIWPGGSDQNAKGTIDWAGGPIDWDSEAIKKDGYYFAQVKDVTIDCYQTDSPPGTNSGTSYTYTDARGTNDTVKDGDEPTILKSLLGTGLNMDKDVPKDAKASDTPEFIPGQSGSGSVPGQGGSGTSGGGSSGSSDAAPACTQTGFTQDCGATDENTQGTSQGIRRPDSSIGASAFAAIIALGAMLWM